MFFNILNFLLLYPVSLISIKICLYSGDIIIFLFFLDIRLAHLLFYMFYIPFDHPIIFFL